MTTSEAVHGRHDRSQAMSMTEAPIAYWVVGEIVAMVALCFLYAGGVAPDVNEAHYLCKAKHFWQPDWCRDDFFLNSADAHLVFYWTIGWLSRFMSLTAVAWVGRFATWTMLSASWWWLCRSLGWTRGYALLSLAIALLLWDRCHMAGEWVVGGVEAKGIAYALVFWGIAELVRGRWRATFWIFGAASSFHVLVGGWTTVAACIVLVFDRKHVPRWRDVSWGLLGGAVLATPGIVPALQLSLSADSTEQWLASEIYVYQRLGHHLLPQRMHPLLIGRFVALACGWGILLGWRRPREGQLRLQQLVAAALILAGAGIVIAWWLSPSRALTSVWMRYYWFRQTDSLVPVGVTIFLTDIVRRLHSQPTKGRLATVVLSASMLAPAIHLSQLVYWRCRDPRPNAIVQGSPFPRGAISGGELEYVDWLEICDWIRTETSFDAVILSPYRQQTLKWYAERAEVVTWKDVPQDTRGLVEWWRRSRAVRATRLYRPGRRLSPAGLADAICEYDVDYVIVEQMCGRLPPSLPLIYQNATYRLHVVPRNLDHESIERAGDGPSRSSGSKAIRDVTR